MITKRDLEILRTCRRAVTLEKLMLLFPSYGACWNRIKKLRKRGLIHVLDDYVDNGKGSGRPLNRYRITEKGLELI